MTDPEPSNGSLIRTWVDCPDRVQDGPLDIEWCHIGVGLCIFCESLLDAGLSPRRFVR